MINLTPIAKKIQERMRQKMNALGRDTPYYPDSETSELTQEKMLSRTTFMKMVSGQRFPVTLMGGEKIPGDGGIRGGYNEIYGARTSVSMKKENGILLPQVSINENSEKRPMPGVKSMTATFQGGMRSRREATISWVCWSFDDLNRLMPHFLAHGKTVMIQWGWIYDNTSLQNIRSYTNGGKIEEDAFSSNYVRNVIDNSGDYDMMVGIIKNFSFTARQDGGFDCETVITSVGMSLLSSTEGTISSIDPMITYNLIQEESDDKKTFKIKQAEEDAIQNGDNNKLVRLNSTVSLKIFLSKIDDYIVERFNSLPRQARDRGFVESSFGPTKGGKFEIGYVNNKYLYMEDSDRSRKNFWVRWGWFEDNVLSKFLSVTSKDKKIISEFRSIERRIDSKSIKPLDEFEGTKIKSHPQMQTLSINDYILPGKFFPQTEAFTKKIFGEDVTFPGDNQSIIKLSQIVNETTKFAKFDVTKGEPPTEGPQGQKIKKNSKGQYFYFINGKDNSDGSKIVKVDDNQRNFGYMRNMLINTKLIKQAFGVGDEVNTESINIFESIQSLFQLLNKRLAYWDFELVSDELDTHRLKIIDGTTTWIDFRKPPSSATSVFLDTDIIGKPGVFYFPVWKHNSIVKNQDLQAKIPNSMQLAAMYGSNLDALKNANVASFQEVLGTAAGGLFNDEDDERNKGLDIAFQNENTENLGTTTAGANEPLTNKGDNIKDFVIKNAATLTDRLNDRLNDVSEKILAMNKGGNEGFFDSSKPPPFIDQLDDKQLEDLLTAGEGYSGDATTDDFTVELSEKYKQLFSSKYDDSGNMRNAYIGTIDTLISYWDKDDNNRNNRPLKMLFDLSLDIDGIGGIVPGNSFHSSYLPQKYLDSCVFQATNVEHSVDSSGWTTSINGMMRSTLGYIFRDISASKEIEELLENTKKDVAKAQKQKTSKEVETQVAMNRKKDPSSTVEVATVGNKSTQYNYTGYGNPTLGKNEQKE